MVGKNWVLVAACAALMVTACGRSAGPNVSTPAPASGPAAAVQTNSYNGAGTVKALYPNQKAPAIEIDHGDIEGLMPAMQMEFPVTDAKLLNGLAVNDRIDFTVENAPDGMKVTAIKKK